MESIRPQAQPVERGPAPIRPSLIFWALLIITAIAGWRLAQFGDEGLDFLGFSPTLGMKLTLFVFVAVGWVVTLSLHEFGHALVAWYGGDHTVVEKGYLNLDPRKYTEPGMSLILPLVFLMLGGIGLPGGAVWIQTNLIKEPLARSLMSAAGPFANLVCAVVLLAPLTFDWVDPQTHTALAIGLGFLGFLQITAFLLNMIPVPGLDGFGIIEPHLSKDVLLQLRPMRQYGFIILLGLLWFVPPARDAFWDTLHWAFRLSGADDALVSEGFRAFQFWR